MHPILLLAIGGAAGTIARYYLGLAIVQRVPLGIPVGTLVVNVTGCFILSIIATLALERGALLTPEYRLLLGVGFCGSYTTLSAVSVEALAMLQANQVAAAASYVVATNVLSILAALMGYWLIRGLLAA